MGAGLSDQPCVAFARMLASREPVPGGGGAAALAGALAAALCSMVGSYTLGKRRYAAVEEDIERLMSDAAIVRERLLELIDEDAAAFYPLSQAYGIPKNEPGRVGALESATKAACAAPLEMMRQTARAIELLEEMGEKGSALLLSDVGCGVLLARAALEAASLNVFVNTASLPDCAWVAQTESTCDELLAVYLPRADACAASVVARLRGA